MDAMLTADGNNCDTTEGHVSLAEVMWDYGGVTWFGVSQLDEYNLPITVDPFNATGGGNCKEADCFFNIDQNCPEDDKVKKNGRSVACRNPNKDAETYYSRAIKRCPGAYSWTKCDPEAIRTCNGNDGVHIQFC